MFPCTHSLLVCELGYRIYTRSYRYMCYNRLPIMSDGFSFSSCQLCHEFGSSEGVRTGRALRCTLYFISDLPLVCCTFLLPVPQFLQLQKLDDRPDTIRKAL